VSFLPFIKKRLMENSLSELPRKETSVQRQLQRRRRPLRKVPEMDVASATETIIFFVFATITILGALGLIYAQRVAHSMLSLIFCFMAVSGIFILMGAEFLAAIQILVYLASVGLVVLFGIMLTRRQIQEEDFE
jgi:NADH-quinone oxidoreductase subunit J